MSIASEIQRIKNNISDAYTAVSNKGGTLPQVQNSSNLSTSVGSISGGGSALTYVHCKPSYDIFRDTNRITYNNGIASNFYVSSDTSVARWLYGDNYFPNYQKLSFTSLEIVVTIKIGSPNASNGTIIMSSYSNQIFDIAINKNWQLLYHVGSGTIWYNEVSNKPSSNTINPNTFYNIKLTYDGTTYTLDVATDFENYENWISGTFNRYPGDALGSTTQVDFQFGSSRLNESKYNGTGLEIDLSKCYIKVDDTMYWQGLETITSTADLMAIRGFSIAS